MSVNITLPHVKMGRPNDKDRELLEHQLELFCEGIQELKSTLDFSVSSRGWCYVLEEYGLNKGDFDRAQRLINDCRKNGMLPLDVCAEDRARSAENTTYYFEEEPIETEAYNAVEHINTTDFVDQYIRTVTGNYDPYHFMDFQDCYIELLVEKIDLKGIFAPVCYKYNIPFANSKGFPDINSRAALMRRFQEWEDRGKQCVLLYCGDHDPGGLLISEIIRENLADLSQAVGWYPDNLIIDRFGLNYEFIEDNNLTWIDNLETGSKRRLDDPLHHDHHKQYVQSYLQQYGARKVEANALVTRVDAGRKLCEQTILKYFNPEGLTKLDQANTEAKQSLYNMIYEQINNE